MFPLKAISENCNKCELHTFPLSPGVDSEWFDKSLFTDEAPLLYVVGQNPGYKEDQMGRPFVGKSGQLLRTVYLEGSHLTDLCAIILTNGVRCRTENNVKPPFRCYKTCSDWMIEDLSNILSTRNKNPLLILTLGGPATTAFWKYTMEEKGSVSLNDAFKRNGTKHTLPELGTSFTFYATYHPAFVLRDPKRINTVHQHTQLILDQLMGVVPESTKPCILRVPMRPSMLSSDTLNRILTTKQKEIPSQRRVRGQLVIKCTQYTSGGTQDYVVSVPRPASSVVSADIPAPAE